VDARVRPAPAYSNNGHAAPSIAGPPAMSATPNGAGGSMSAGTRWYRVRHIFAGQSTAASAAISATTVGTTSKVDLADIPESLDPDYEGWVIERTMPGAPSSGPFYYVASGSGVTTYSDTLEDASIGEHFPFIGYYGVKDEKAQDGTGGSAITIEVEFPWLDDGAPDVLKSLERVEVYAQGSGVTLNLSIKTDPTLAIGSISIPMANTAALWNTLNWGGFNWGAASIETAVASGVMEGMYCRRYKLKFSASVAADFIFKGCVVDIVSQPERPYSRS